MSGPDELMSGPGNGTYQIQPFGINSPPVGVEDSIQFAVPICPAGVKDVFQVTFDSPSRVYSIQVSNRITGVDKDNVVALLATLDDSNPQIAAWKISGRKGGPYVISKPTTAVGAIQCWTLENPSPNPQVILKSYTPDEDQPKWNFIRQ